MECRLEPRPNRLPALKPYVPDPAFHFGAFDRSDDAKAHSLRREAKVSYFLDLVGGDLHEFSLHLFGVDNLIVSKQRLSHPHDLVGCALKTKLILTNRVFLGLAEFFFARRPIPQLVQLAMNRAQRAAEFFGFKSYTDTDKTRI